MWRNVILPALAAASTGALIAMCLLVLSGFYNQLPPAEVRCV